MCRLRLRNFRASCRRLDVDLEFLSIKRAVNDAKKMSDVNFRSLRVWIESIKKQSRDESWPNQASNENEIKN